MSHRSPKSALAASHQRSWLWGRHAVCETLIAGRWPVLELFGDEDLPPEQQSALRGLAVERGVDLRLVSSSRLSDLCRAKDHQGYLARMGVFPYGTFDGLSAALAVVIKFGKSIPLFVICDRIQDAHNFGAILRCCDAMKVDGVIIGERSQASVTPHVARSSAGAVNYLSVFRVTELTSAVDVLKSSHVRVMAASEKAATCLWDADLRQPLAVVIGTESTGIGGELLQLCDLQVSIPMMGRVDSLNAAVAAGIILNECRRQQHSAIGGCLPSEQKHPGIPVPSNISGVS